MNTVLASLALRVGTLRQLAQVQVDSLRLAVRCRISPLTNGWHEDRAGLGNRRLRAALHAPILEAATTTSDHRALAHELAALVASGRFDELSARLRKADTGRWLMADRTPEALAGLRAIVQPVRDALRAGSLPRGLAELDRLSLVLQHRAADPIAAAILAQAHIDIASFLSAKARTGEAEYHARRAADLLAGHDPAALDSPLIAGLRFDLVFLTPDGARKYRSWYHDWTALQPRDWRAHRALGACLAPTGFGGTFDQIDRAGQDACRRLGDRAGAAPYVFFMLAANDAYPGIATDMMDLDLFLQGIEDLCRISASQATYNAAAFALWTMSRDYRARGPEYHLRKDALRRAMAEILRTRLREFHLAEWNGSRAEIYCAVAATFADDIHAGARLAPGLAGIEPVGLPEAPAAA